MTNPFFSVNYASSGNSGFPVVQYRFAYNPGMTPSIFNNGFGYMNMDMMTPMWMQSMNYPQMFPQFDFSGLTYPTYTPQTPTQTTTTPAPSSTTTTPTTTTTTPQRTEAQQKEIDRDVAEICEDLYNAMKGAGTDNDKLKATIERVNKGNVMEVLKAWETCYSDDMDGESLLESIQAEYHTGWFGNRQEQLESHLAEALAERAIDLGLEKEGRALLAKVKSEHSSWFTSDDAIRASFDTLISQIKNKEGA